MTDGAGAKRTAKPELPPPQPLIGTTEFYSETGTEGGYWVFYDTSSGLAPYERMNILKSGDRLTIYDPDNEATMGTILWEGVVRLRDAHAFSESVHGLWVHSVPAESMGVDPDVWGSWFMKQHPARYTPAPSPRPNEPAPSLPPEPWWLGNRVWRWPRGFFHQEVWDSIPGNPDAGYYGFSIGWSMARFGAGLQMFRTKWGRDRWRAQIDVEARSVGLDIHLGGKHKFQCAVAHYERLPQGGTLKRGGL